MKRIWRKRGVAGELGSNVGVESVIKKRISPVVRKMSIPT